MEISNHLDKRRRKTVARLSERDARILLFVRAIEETDRGGVLLTPQSRALATRQALEACEGSEGSLPPDPKEVNKKGGVPTSVLLNRAVRLHHEVLQGTPALARVVEPLGFRRILPVMVGSALIIGLGTNFLGPKRHISVLAFPLAGILAWNLLVYGVHAVSTAKSVASRLGGTNRIASTTWGLASFWKWLERVQLSVLARRLGRDTRSTAVVDAVDRFYRLWIVTVAPLAAARARVVLHLAGLSLALGAILGMYASGIAFEYRARWESTWLEDRAVQRYVDLVLGPAARVLGSPVPNVAQLAGPAGEGSAAPWIHLWATTLGLFVLLPRAALVVLEAGRTARLRSQLLVNLDPAYYRRALASVRGTAVAVEIVYYSCDPEVGLRERLRKLLQELLGARAAIRDGTKLKYGEGPEGLQWPDVEPDSLFLVLVFPLAQTPEAEVHGECLERLQERLGQAGSQLMVVLETATYERRVGSRERVCERWAAWDRFLRELQLTAVELGAVGTAGEHEVDRWVEMARRGIWLRPSA